MSEPVRFLTSFAQSVATMSLYGPSHPARRRAVDASYRILRDLQAHDAQPEFSFLGDEVVYGHHQLREMRDWEWAARLAAAGVQRLEFAADVTREDFEQFLEGVASHAVGDRERRSATGRRFVLDPLRCARDPR